MDGSLAEPQLVDLPPAEEPVSGEQPEGPGHPGAQNAGKIVVRRTTPARRGKARPRTRERSRATKPPTRQGTLRPPMEKFVIEGGVPLSGTIVPAGNKNGALPILAACLLTDDEVILRNVPRISDVEAMMLLLEGLGARVGWRGPGEVSIDASGVDGHEPDRGLSERIR